MVSEEGLLLSWLAVSSALVRFPKTRLCSINIQGRLGRSQGIDDMRKKNLFSCCVLEFVQSSPDLVNDIYSRENLLLSKHILGQKRVCDKMFTIISPW